MSQNIEEFILRIRSQFPDFTSTQIVTLYEEQTKRLQEQEQTKRLQEQEQTKRLQEEQQTKRLQSTKVFARYCTVTSYCYWKIAHIICCIFFARQNGYISSRILQSSFLPISALFYQMVGATHKLSSTSLDSYPSLSIASLFVGPKSMEGAEELNPLKPVKPVHYLEGTEMTTFNKKNL